MKKLIRSSVIGYYLNAKLSDYSADIYTNDKFITIEISHIYNLKKTMKKLIDSVSKDNYQIKIVNPKTNYIDSELTINDKKYIIKMIRSDIDF